MSNRLYTCRWNGNCATSFRGRTYLNGQIDDFDLATAKTLHENGSLWECLEIDQLEQDETNFLKSLEQVEDELPEDSESNQHDGSLEGSEADLDIINDSGKDEGLLDNDKSQEDDLAGSEQESKENPEPEPPPKKLGRKRK